MTILSRRIACNEKKHIINAKQNVKIKSKKRNKRGECLLRDAVCISFNLFSSNYNKMQYKSITILLLLLLLQLLSHVSYYWRTAEMSKRAHQYIQRQLHIFTQTSLSLHTTFARNGIENVRVQCTLLRCRYTDYIFHCFALLDAFRTWFSIWNFLYSRIIDLRKIRMES